LENAAGLAAAVGAAVAFRRDLAAGDGEGLAALTVFDFAFGEESDFFDFIGDRARHLP
jgi:hypothetical protein